MNYKRNETLILIYLKFIINLKYDIIYYIHRIPISYECK